MSKVTKLSYGNEAREHMKIGVDAVADAVKVTLGPAGRHVAIHKFHGQAPHITKDGVTVADSIQSLSNKFQDAGAQIIKQSATQTAGIAGDGTTTATVLAQKMIHLGIAAVESGENAVNLKREMDEMTKRVVEEIALIATPVKIGSPELLSIATISANNDASLGKVITDAMIAVGEDGIIYAEDSASNETYVKTSTGLEIDKGFVTEAFINSRNRVELDNPVILMYPKKISELKDILSIIDQCALAKRSLLIISDNIDSSALGGLVRNRTTFTACAIKLPGFGAASKQMLEDVAVYTGGIVMDEDLGEFLQKATIQKCGSASKVIITRDSTTIFGGNGKQTDIDARVSQLKDFLNGESIKAHEKTLIAKRIAKLQAKSAIIYIGAPTEIERKEKRDRVDDAKCAALAALEEGFVAGAGTTYLHLRDRVMSSTGTGPISRGGNLILESLFAPATQILTNAGISDYKQPEDNLYGWGVNAKTLLRCDLIKNGIIDSAKVTRVALENACSVAGMLITMECAMIDEEEGHAK